MATNNLIRLASFLARLHMARSTFYDRLNPSSPRHDPDLPRPIPLGSGKTSPVAFIEAEVDAYIGKLIERARSPEGEFLSSVRRGRGRELVAARRAKSVWGAQR